MVRVKRVKTTFAATAPRRPIIADCENGSKILRTSRHAAVDVALTKMGRYAGVYADRTLLDNHDTVIIDPIGELMEKLIALHAK